MKARVDALLQEVAADLSRGGFDAEFLNRSVARMGALVTETEADRYEYMAGYVRFVDYLLAQAPTEAVEILGERRRLINAHFDRLYGHSETPYLKCNRIVSKLFEGFKVGSDDEEAVAQAMAELEAVNFDESPEDELLMMGAVMRIRSLKRARDWFAQEKHEGPVEDLLVAIVEHIETAAAEGCLDIALILKFSETIKDPSAALPEARKIIASMLMLVFGVGLMFRIDAAPALEPLRDRIIRLSGPPSPPPDTTESRCEAVLKQMTDSFERDGFSEYAFRLATAALQELPSEKIEDSEAIQAATLRMFDLAIPHAPLDIGQMLLAARGAAERQRQVIAGSEAPVPAEVLRTRSELILQTFRDELAAGESPGAVFTKASGELQALGLQLSSDDEEGARILLGVMNELPKAILPYAPEPSQTAGPEAIATLDEVFGGLDALSSDDQATAAIQTELVKEQLSRLGQAAEPGMIAPDFAGVRYIRQFVELIPSFTKRLSDLGLESDEATKDGAEIKRLNKRYERTAAVMGAAYTEEQFLQHQRSALRRIAVELRRFERRHYLMIVDPPFPTNAVTIDPNAVFFSGTSKVASLLGEACQTLRIDVAATHGVDNPTHARWQQLRQAGVAVFDYSAYDPGRADPGNKVPSSRAAEANILRAAGPIAQVAYETGWAYVLGTPVVIVARHGQTIPFDIDIEPVTLQDDGRDAERLVAAIQAALYGIQRAIAGDCLAATVAEVRKRYPPDANPKIRALVDAVTDGHDATQARLALSAALDHIDGDNSLLVLPAFEGSYPNPGRARLFHVAAFRDWGKMAQEETRKACERADVDYVIGYERLNPDVLRTIWSDLCEASFVVADITNLNPNAVLELAIAHALGRRTLVVTQNKEPHAHLPAIQKVRTHHYEARDGHRELAKLLDAFLAIKK